MWWWSLFHFCWLLSRWTTEMEMYYLACSVWSCFGDCAMSGVSKKHFFFLNWDLLHYGKLSKTWWKFKAKYLINCKYHIKDKKKFKSKMKRLIHYVTKSVGCRINSHFHSQQIRKWERYIEPDPPERREKASCLPSWSKRQVLFLSFFSPYNWLFLTCYILQWPLGVST